MSICRRDGNVYWTDFVAPRVGKKPGHPSAVDLAREGERQACTIDDLVIQKLVLDWEKDKSIWSSRQSVFSVRELGISHFHLKRSVDRIAERLSIKPGCLRVKETSGAFVNVSMDTATYFAHRSELADLVEEALIRRGNDVQRQ